MRIPVACASLAALFACSDPPADPTGPFLPETLALTATVPAGGEIFRCRYFVLPEGARDAIRFEHDYTAGSHHILLYPTSLTAGDVADDLDPFDCNSRGDLAQTGVAYGADEQPVGEMAFPPGVGMHFEGGDVVLLEAHYLNTTDDDLDATVSVTLHFAEEPVATHAGTLFYYNWSILIPPAPGTATARMRCVVPEDIELMYATSHMHRRGTQFRSWLLEDGASEPVSLHMTDDWAAPIADVFLPPRTVTAGSVIEFECDFQNDRPHAVVEGDSADDNEMCMFIASYWPQMDLTADYCLVEGSGPVLDGARTCLQTLDCLETVTEDVAAQECLQDTCSASSTSLSSFLLCIDENGCGDSESCIVDRCLDEYLACESASC